MCSRDVCLITAKITFMTQTHCKNNSYPFKWQIVQYHCLQHNIHPSIYYSLHLKQLSSHEESTKKGLTLHTTSSAPPPFQLSVGSSMPFLITQGFSIMAHDALSPHWHDYEVHFCLFVLCFSWSTALLVWPKRLKNKCVFLVQKRRYRIFALHLQKKPSR